LHWNGLRQAEGEPSLGSKAHIFLSGRVGRSSGSRSPDRSSDQRTFATARQPTNEGTSAGATPDDREVSLFV
jgi:hypothetical protein